MKLTELTLLDIGILIITVIIKLNYTVACRED